MNGDNRAIDKATARFLSVLMGLALSALIGMMNGRYDPFTGPMYFAGLTIVVYAALRTVREDPDKD